MDRWPGPIHKVSWPLPHSPSPAFSCPTQGNQEGRLVVRDLDGSIYAEPHNHTVIRGQVEPRCPAPPLANTDLLKYWKAYKYLRCGNNLWSRKTEKRISYFSISHLHHKQAIWFVKLLWIKRYSEIKINTHRQSKTGIRMEPGGQPVMCTHGEAWRKLHKVSFGCITYKPALVSRFETTFLLRDRTCPYDIPCELRTMGTGPKAWLGEASALAKTVLTKKQPWEQTCTQPLGPARSIENEQEIDLILIGSIINHSGFRSYQGCNPSSSQPEIRN